MLFHESCGRSITAAPRGQRPVNAERPHGPVEHLRTWLRPRSRNAPRVADGRRDPRGATVSRTGGATPGAREGREGGGGVEGPPTSLPRRFPGSDLELIGLGGLRVTPGISGARPVAAFPPRLGQDSMTRGRG
jgi:hypothetical protein